MNEKMYINNNGKLLYIKEKKIRAQMCIYKTV